MAEVRIASPSPGRSVCRKRFLSLPPLRRFLAIGTVGSAAIAGAYAYRRSLRPKEVPTEVAAKGLAEVREVVALVRRSEFGKTERGAALTTQVCRFLDGGRLAFSAELKQEALYRDEVGRASVLYVGVYGCPRGFVLPGRGELAERTYHEALHALKRSGRKTYQEECDAYCAAEEARAAVERRPPRFPLRREGLLLWHWVRSAYADAVSDPDYEPLGCSRRELELRAGIDRAGDAAP